jgi:hypothetical protein
MGKSVKDKKKAEARNNNRQKPTRAGTKNGEKNEPELEEKGGADKKEDHKGAKKALRHAVKAKVKEQRTNIAEKLVAKVVNEGDLKGTAMVLTIMEKTRKDGENGGKKQKGANWAQLLVLEQECEDAKRKEAEEAKRKAASS